MEQTEYFQDQTLICVPQLQQAMGCNYAQARQQLTKLQEQAWVGTKARGLFYEVNRAYIFRRDWSAEQCRQEAQQLQERDVALLENLLRLSRRSPGIPRFRLKIREAQLQNLMALGLVHAFEENIYMSVKERTVRELRSILDSREDVSMSLVHIGYPMVLLEDAQKQERVDAVLSCPYLSEACSEYIRKWRRRRKYNGTAPEAPVNRSGGDPLRLLTYEMIEALVSRTDCESKDAFEKEAMEALETLESAGICSELVLQAARRATHEICRELTLSNLQEIRRILQGDED